MIILAVHMTSVVCLVLDKSSSMSTVTDAAISGTNEFVSGLDPSSMFGIILFDTEVCWLQEISPVAEYVPLTKESYRPRGMTALYDAVISAIEGTQSYIERMRPDGKTYNPTIVIQTDGQENSSQRITCDALKEQISTLTAKGWQFVFLGANQDACFAAETIGIGQGSAISYSHTGTHTKRAMGHASKLIERSRVLGTAASFTNEERQDSLDPSA